MPHFLARCQTVGPPARWLALNRSRAALRFATRQSAQVFRERCSACHTLERVYLALEESQGKDKAPPWMHIVQRMREKAPEWISAQEAEQIMTYLQSLKPVKNGAPAEGQERR